MAHKGIGTDNKDLLEKQRKSTTVENQTSNTRKEDSGQRSRSGKRRDTGNTEEEESSAYTVYFPEYLIRYRVLFKDALFKIGRTNSERFCQKYTAFE